jgi:hypothetical protein
MTDDAKDTKTDDVKNWPRVVEVTNEASLHGRRIHRGDILQAAELGAETIRSVLVSKGYEADVIADVTFSYRAMRQRVTGEDGTS